MLFSKRENIRATTALFACTAAAVLMVGCGDKTPDTSTTVINQTAPDAVPASPMASGKVVTNDTNAGPGGATGTQTEISDTISRTITRNTQMTGSRVNVVVDSAGVATLTGFTQNPQQKALAEKAAKDAVGVTSVSNKLEIRPTGGVGKASPAPPSGPQTQVIVVPGAPAPASAAPADAAPAPAMGDAPPPMAPRQVPAQPAAPGGPRGSSETAPAAPPVTNP